MKRGSTLNYKDIYIRLFDNNGNPADPYLIQYDLLKPDGSFYCDSLTPARFDVGYYWLNWTIPKDADIGLWQIVWRIKEQENSIVVLVTEKFYVLPENARWDVPYSERIAKMIKGLRDLLRDNYPDRNYHFLPPTFSEQIKDYNKEFRYIWLDDELYNHIEQALSFMNEYPPRSSYQLDTIPEYWVGVLLLGAASLSCQALAANWVADEFNYNIGGISLDLDKSSRYRDLANSYWDMFLSRLEQLKLAQKKFKVLVQPSLAPALFNAALVADRAIWRRRLS